LIDDYWGLGGRNRVHPDPETPRADYWELKAV